jgi:hypothetical protein
MRPGADFDGATYERAFDHQRLTGQLLRVYAAFLMAEWWTLEEIGALTHDRNTASVSARVRDLRKAKFGGHTVERRRRGEAARGVFEYRLVRRGENLDLWNARGAGPNRAAAHGAGPVPSIGQGQDSVP